MTSVHIAPAATEEAQEQEQRAACGVDDDDGDDVKASIDGMGGQEWIQADERRSTRLSRFAFKASLMKCLLDGMGLPAILPSPQSFRMERMNGYEMSKSGKRGWAGREKALCIQIFPVVKATPGPLIG